MKLAVIDIGSNTVILSIYKAGKKTLKECYCSSVPAGLINYIEDGRLSGKGIRVLSDIIGDFEETARRKSCHYVFPFATASLRKTSNADEIIAKVHEETGYTIDLIDGDDEAAFSFASMYDTMKKEISKEGLMADMGGGSTEIVSFRSYHPYESVSLEIGVLALYRDFVNGILPSPAEIKSIRKYCSSLYRKNPFIGGYGDALYMIGGTAKAIAKLHAFTNDRPCVFPYTMSADELEKLLSDILSDRQKDAKLAAISLIPQRIHTVCPGIIAISELMKEAGAKTLTVTTANVRDGYAAYIGKVNGLI